nr:MAG TPA: hypothetical protein [Caudoviricetes sp.]
MGLMLMLVVVLLVISTNNICLIFWLTMILAFILIVFK